MSKLAPSIQDGKRSVGVDGIAAGRSSDRSEVGLGGDVGVVAAMVPLTGDGVGGARRRDGLVRVDDCDEEGDCYVRCNGSVAAPAAAANNDSNGDAATAGLEQRKEGFLAGNGYGYGYGCASSDYDHHVAVRSFAEQKFLTLPTILTLSRVAAVPALLAVFYSQETWATTAGATIFVVAALTDWLDGYLARKMGSSSEFGAFLDPVADKLMVATTLVLLCTRPPIAALAKVGPWLLPLPAIAIIGREITMSALREWAASQGGDIHRSVAVNSLGKWKTAAQMVALTLLLAGRDGRGGIALGAAGVSLLYISAGLALWSLVVYIRSMWKRLAK